MSMTSGDFENNSSRILDANLFQSDLINFHKQSKVYSELQNVPNKPASYISNHHIVHQKPWFQIWSVLWGKKFLLSVQKPSQDYSIQLLVGKMVLLT